MKKKTREQITQDVLNKEKAKFFAKGGLIIHQPDEPAVRQDMLMMEQFVCIDHGLSGFGRHI